MSNLFGWLLDTSGFTPRTQCGPAWTDQLVFLHIFSDCVIFVAYVGIPLGLLWMYRYFSRRVEMVWRLRVGFFLSMAFVLLCGLTHISNSLMFTVPAYRLDGAVKLACAVVSLATILWIPLMMRGLLDER